jgi:hypothetical protein
MAGPAIALASPAASATTPASSQLHGVSCVNATTCFAVGESLGRLIGQGRTLVERWNGKTWSIVAGPNPSGARYATLFGISCASATSCFAVGIQIKTGATANTALVERWNGKAWAIVATPSLSSSKTDSTYLNGVSCSSATFCVATGSLYVADKNGSVTAFKTVVEQWNGTKWSVVPTPAPPGSTGARLYAASCTSATACVAVGDQILKVRPPGSFAAGPVTLTERWNGKTWSAVASPSPTIGSGATLLSVSCTSTTNCLAAGQYAEGDLGRPGLLTEHWNGKSWSLLASHPPNRAYSWLSSVSCAATTSCMATGYFSTSQFNAKGSKTLVERWNGTGFSLGSSPNAAFYNILDGVSCVSATVCIAVGRSATAQVNANRTLAEQWNGTKWSVVPSPNPAP